MTFESLTLDGCAPTPLASYLKGLGILRLISSDASHVSGRAADPDARGWWENESFHLTTKLSDEALIRFFLDDYAPSPIIAPWNGRAGFLEGETGETSNRGGAELMRAIQTSTSRRLENMQRTIGSLRQNDKLGEYNHLRAKTKALQEELKKLTGHQRIAKDEERKRVEKQSKRIKSLLLPTLRSETNSDHLSYIDACYVLSTDEVAAPLLGSGGNDGSRDFGVNFAEKLTELFDFEDGTPTERGGAELDAALFDSVQRLNASGSMGQFSPGQGGANATTGYTGHNPLNTWDVVLAMEGTIAFAGALTRRWGATGDTRAAFPFTFKPTGAGTGSLSSEDPNRPRGELWTPLWTKPATMSEIVAIFAEGRLTIGRRTAHTGLDAARSVRRIGLSRGISGFERYSIIQPDNKMPYQATPLGRFNVPDRPQSDLIEDLEAGGWLEHAQRLTGNKKTVPARARQAMRKLTDALFLMNDTNRASEGTRHALTALGGLVGWLATNPKVRQELKPPRLLSSDWIRMADDGSAEFRIAAALAGLGLPAAEHGESVVSEPIPEDENAPVTENGNTEPPAREMLRASPMAVHFAPIDEKNFFYKQRLSAYRAWSSDAAPPTVVWGTGSLISNMIAVLERRLVDAAIRGLGDKPLAGAIPARLSDVAMFLSGDFDDERCAALLRGLVWAQPPLPIKKPRDAGPSANPPFAYAALKPIFVPDETLRRVGVLAETARMPVPPGLTASLRTGGDSRDGRVTDTSVRAALSRARASGLPSPFDPARSGAPGVGFDSGRIGAGVRSDRLAASLLIPVSDIALRDLLQRVYPSEPEGNTELMEDPKDGD